MRFSTRLIAALAALTCSFALTACGGSGSSSSAPASSAPASSEETPSQIPTGSNAPIDDDDAAGSVTINVGASPAPHAEILAQIKPILAEQGIDLVITEFTDYVIPNNALDEKSIDANYFQHLPYLEDFNTQNKTELVSAVAVHFEPLGLYAGKTASVEALADGATIAVPNDKTNEARALQLLESLGIIKLKEGVGLEATPIDIVENPKNIKFQEIEAAQVPRVLPDVDLAVINGNYALSGGVVDKVLTTEDKSSEGAKKYANILAVRKGDESRPEIQALIAALTSEQVRTYIEATYNGVVVPVF